MFSSSIPITPYVLSIPCSQAPTGQKWHLYRGKINEVGLIWDQALFSFRFENYIPAGKAKRKEPISAVAVRENVWEPLKLGLISG